MLRSSRAASPFVVLLVAAAFASALTGCGKKQEVAEPAPPPAQPIDTTAAQPSPPPPESTPEEAPSEGVQEQLRDIFFDFDAAVLSSTAQGTLDANGKVLQDHAQVNVTIEGHCDERGTVEYNLALGDRRAAAARDYLVRYGIAAGRMSTISYGEERPAASGSNEEAWAQNRRAHFVTR